ncbi:MAG: protein kinase [Planctomycetota bacterium]|nr:protein kinase [Planctomycetota bacterium]
MSEAPHSPSPDGGTSIPRDQPEPSVLDLVARRIGEAPRITLREEDSAAVSSPVIDPSSKEKVAVPVGRSNYQFLGEIARGGMGVILKGHDTDLGRDVAVKVLDKRLADRPEVVQRFVEEAQIGGQLQHPGIVPVYELGTMKDERPFFTMKLVKGRTLATLLAEREAVGANRQRLIAIFESVCQTMAYAHSRGVIHRDLKPANIMVGAFGEVQVVDWGLAKVLLRGGTADESRARVAQSQFTVLETVRSSKGSSTGTESMIGSVLGTPAYMPPEQASGHVDRLDERADVFALGAILCEILTGSPPYVGERDLILSAAAQAELEDAYARLDACGADPELIKLTRQCLTPAALARPANAGVLAERLHNYIVTVEERAHAAQVQSAAAQVRVQEERKARKLTAALGVSVAAILAAIGGGWAFVQSERSVRERGEAARALVESERDAKLSAEVGDALGEASVHEGGQRWADAIGAAERARALAQGGGANAELLSRVETVLARLRAADETARRESERETANRLLLADLLEAREPSWEPGREDPAHAVAVFESVFKKHGIDLDSGTVEEAAEALRARGLGSEIGLFLDSLTELRRKAGKRDGITRVLDLAHAIDPDPQRADLREALAAGELEVLRFIAKSGFEDQPAITIELLGSAFQQLNQREDARKVYRIGIERFPDYFSLQYRLGRLLTPPELENGITADKQEAVECFRAALALRPDSTVVRYYLGRLYYKLQEFERAHEQFTIALSQRPDDGTFLFHLGNCELSMGNIDTALAIERPLVERQDPPWLEEWAANATGRCLMARGEVAEAARYFQRAVDKNPVQSNFHGGLLEAVILSGSSADAVRVAQRYAERFPDDPEVLNNLAWVLATTPDVDKRDYTRAIELARRSLQLAETDAASNTLGVALYYSGDAEGATEALRRSIRLQGSGNVVDWMFLARAHKQLGRESEARDWYERVVDYMNVNKIGDPEFLRFRAETDAEFAR